MNNLPIKHARVSTYYEQPDGNQLIVTQSYLDSLKDIKHEIEQNILTNRGNLVTDVIKCLAIITEEQSRRLSLEIKYEHGKMLIIKKWVVSKEKV
jgi:hypothetical protein